MWHVRRRIKVHTGFVGNPEVKRPLAKPAHKLEKHFKMNLQEVGRGGMDWPDLT